MNTTEVLALLKANRDERGIESWQQRHSRPGGLESFGIGLTRLRKLAKQIGKDHTLALKLWKSRVYDARVISLLVDDPRQISREQAEAQVEQLEGGLLAHVFASCHAPLARAPFAVDIASDWMASEDAMRRHCGFTLLYEISKDSRKSAPDEAFFLERVGHIRRAYPGEERYVRGAMGGALIGIGKRSAKLNTAALKLARAIGPIPLGSDESSCEPLDVVKHLTSDYITKKLGL